MYKKVVLILSALIIFSLPYQQQYVEGAILSKVASKGAQKIVKEVIKESAFDIAVNLFIDEAYKMADADKAKYQAQSEYEAFCGKKMPDLITCEKPMQAKKVLTSADKTNIGNQAEIELDKLITGGKGFTRWQKFLDWLLPIWVASFALTAITYAIDPEVKSLFNEAGYNALVALGLIKPVYENVNGSEIPTESANPPTPSQTTGTTPEGYATQYFAPSTSQYSNLYLDVNQPSQNGLFVTQISPTSSVPKALNWYFTNTNQPVQINATSMVVYQDIINVTTANPATLTISYNGVVDAPRPFPNTAAEKSTLTISGNPNISPSIKKMQSVLYRMPYEINGFLYTDVLMTTTDGNVLKYQIKSASSSMPANFTTVKFGIQPEATPTSAYRLTYYPNYFGSKEILVPSYEEVEPQMDMVGESKYSDGKGQIALIPPSALPYTQTSTGIQLTPETDPNTGEQKFTTPTGESVPEDDITVGEPNVQDNPSPSPNTVTPPATQTNPNPEPIPLTPVSPPKTPTPIETDEPVFPEGESCDVGLKLPRFNPLMHTISDAFPFSIPFDLKDGFDALFAEMGNEKPEFDYKFNFMGDEQSWNITIPDYFDSWKAFTDSFLIFIFDIGIIYAIYRFMGGGN